MIHLHKGDWTGNVTLNSQYVERISSFLVETKGNETTPFKLTHNLRTAFQGTILQGMGFVLDLSEARQLLLANPINRDVVKPYIIGNDITSSPIFQPSRYVIDFQDWEISKCEEYSSAFAVVKERVYPKRQEIKRIVRKQNWWQFAERAKSLYSSITDLSQVIAFPLTSKYAIPVIINVQDESGQPIVFDQSLIVIASSDFGLFSCLSSSLHYYWIIKYGTPLETRPRYSVTKCCETFPFPKSDGLQEIGKNYSILRQEILISRSEGITQIYNRVHSEKENASDIVALRMLLVELDNAVTAKYGWSDLDLGHDFHETPQGGRYTISEAARREVLRRLLKLNHERYEEECRQGLHDKGAKAGKGKGGKAAKARAKATAALPRQTVKSSAPAKATRSETPAPRVAKPKAAQTPPASQSQLGFFQNETAAPPLAALTRLPFMGLQGVIYRCPMPYGKYDPEGQGLVEMKQKKVDVVVMLASDKEARAKTGRDLRKLYHARGFQVIHLPIPDFGVPERAALNGAVQKVVNLARQGKNIAVHCSAGMGRTGLFMAEVAKQAMKMTGQSALYWVRLYIDGAVETEKQERFVIYET